MSNYPLVRFVDSPAVGATVRLDLNDSSASASRRVEADFDLGVPTLEGDPDAIGQQFGFRSPRFNVQVKGTKANALAFVSALSKELLRRTNWVMFQLNAATSPVWFRIYRAGYQPLALDRVYGNSTSGGNAPAGFPDVWRVEAPLVADAFAYGARVSMSTFQVVQSPADLASPTRTAMHVVLPTIKGDAPTALRIAISPAGTFQAPDDVWMVGCIAGETTLSDPVIDVGIGDNFNAGTNTGAGVSNTAYFSGSYRLASIAANDLSAGSNFSQRLSGTLLVAPPQGRYKLLVRVELDAAATLTKNYILAGGVGTNAATLVYGSSVTVRVGPTVAGATRQGWVDLGDFTFPPGTLLPQDFAGTLNPSAIGLKIGTADNSTGTARIDAFKLVPITGQSVTAAQMLTSTGTSRGLATTDTGVFDGDSDLYYQVDVSNVINPSIRTAKGGYPLADPAAPRNLLIVMALSAGSTGGTAGQTTTIAAKDAASTVVVSYYPRYLHVGDGT